MRGLYIHIPFCKTICSYCDFPKLVSKHENHIKYIDFLINEIETKKNELTNIDTVYIGGGTPNSIDLKLLEKLFIYIKPYLDSSLENTIELNPELVTDDLCLLLNKYNINRVSLGVQTLNDNHIKLLNRHHNKDIVFNAVGLLRKYNINNINIDLIFGIPGSSINDIENDLSYVSSLNPTHISYYSLILEEKTIFYHLLNKNNLTLLDDDLVADMYEYILNKLNNLGYKHYEISNFAKEGYESLHNLKYWNVDEYLGFGFGAASYYNNKRYSNSYNMNAYYKNEDITIDDISILESKNEFMMLGLRKTEGVSIDRYNRLYNSNLFEDFNLNKLIDNKLLIIENNYIKIPKDKLFIANLIFEEFVGD